MLSGQPTNRDQWFITIMSNMLPNMSNVNLLADAGVKLDC